MPKEKSINPAQAQRKAEKAKAVKKGKAEAQSRRNEKLARRNPDRLQTQLNELKAIESSGGKLTNHEKSLLEGLEKEVKAVRKAREALGDAAPKLSSNSRSGGDRDGERGSGSRGGFSDRGRGGRGGGNVLGKRRRYDEDESSEDADEVPEDVKRIPMPRDTPPPFPKEVLDKWYSARRERIARERGENQPHSQSSGSGPGPGSGTNANSTPLGANDRSAAFAERHTEGGRHNEVPRQPPLAVEAKTVYEAKPVVRDLRKEAISFIPAAVRQKLDKSQGKGGLVEPEEADRLEREGYLCGGRKEVGGIENQTQARDKNQDQSGSLPLRAVMMEEVEDEDG